MKKNDLIKLLQGVEGNPDVVIWNGLVEDIMPISKEYEIVELVKENKDHYYQMLFMERARSLNTMELPQHVIDDVKKRAEKMYKCGTYDFPNPFLAEEKYDEWYCKRRKKAIILQPSLTGKKYWDRTGVIKY
jgi:hypothetical protein